MRKISSRFFVILLHLLGVSQHHLPSWYYYLTTSERRDGYGTGIVGVHPHSIVLERLDLEQERGLDRIDWLQDTDDSGEPVWLQDTLDGKCLGPTGGFSECGDANLWNVLKRRRDLNLLRLGVFGFGENAKNLHVEEPFFYALQLVELQYENKAKDMSQKRKKKRLRNDCLVESKDHSSLLQLESCSRRKASWTWRVDDRGVLYHRRYNERQKDNSRSCMVRNNKGRALLGECSNATEVDEKRLVQFALVRYNPTTSTSHATRTNDSTRKSATPETNGVVPDDEANEGALDATNKEDEEKKQKPPSFAHVLTMVDIAHSHASGPLIHSIYKNNFDFPSPKLPTNTHDSEQRWRSPSPFTLLKDTNPILFIGDSVQEADGKFKGRKPARQGSNNRPMAHPPTTESRDETTYKPKKIVVHPYIAASKNEVWVDPQTGLEYATDLCQYLGHDRKESGRHTLMGVGQYTKTVFNIKIYGISFYLSKRDVLADPSFKQFAGLSAEELRIPEFYKHLRTAGQFDRTILLKTNMQLSVETMSSSLESDWKLLSDDAIQLLSGSALRQREADQVGLDIITRPNNPSKCSCSQVAPEQFNADPSCCARGTELAFTWRKNGDLEIRLNGRVMDIFPRPDIAQGIFYEYFRQDDPFSHDFLERVVDGFPFLLAPLDQVSGIASPVVVQQHVKPTASGKGLLKTVGGVGESLASHIAGFAGAVGQSTMGFASNTVGFASHGAQSVGEALKHIGNATAVLGDVGDFLQNVQGDLDQKREFVVEQLKLVPKQHPGLFSWVPSEVIDSEDEPVERQTETVQIDVVPLSHNPFASWYGDIYEAPDDIGPMISPTLNRKMLAFVHLYLLLLLVVSVPGSNVTRTKLVIRRHCLSQKGNVLTRSLKSSDTGWMEGSRAIDGYRRHRKGENFAFLSYDGTTQQKTKIIASRNSDGSISSSSSRGPQTPLGVPPEQFKASRQNAMKNGNIKKSMSSTFCRI